MAAQTRKRSTPTAGRSNYASLKQIISMLNHVSKDELDTVRAYLKSVKARSADEAVIMTSLPESGEGGDLVIRIPASEPRWQVITVKARKLQREQMPAKEDMRAEMERHFDEFRQELLANSWTTTRVAEHLNVTREAIRQRIAARQLFGIKFGKNLRFPKWQ